MKVTHGRLLAGCLLVVTFFGGAAWGSAQSHFATQPVAPVVLSGSDIGFRMHGRKAGTPVGELVVRIDGEWKPVQFDYTVKPVTK